MIQHRPIWWFPFDPREWLTVASSKNLSIPAQGVFIRLLCHQWLHGSIPNQLDDIIRILNGYTGEGISDILKLFLTHRGKEKGLYYPPLEAARHEAIIKSTKLRAAGKKGAAKRYAKLQPIQPHSRDVCATN